MPLLNLPPELFKFIIRDLVSVAGIRAAWKLRMTCRTFASEISHEIFSQRPLKALLATDLAAITENNLGILLFNRLKRGSGVHRSLLDKLRQMSDFVIQAVRPATVSEGHELSLRLCNAVGACIGRSLVFALLGDSPPLIYGNFITEPDCLGAPFNLAQKITAALAIGDQDLVRSLLPALLKSAKWGLPLFGPPLSFAISHGDHEIIRTVLQCMSEYGGHGGVTFSEALTYDYYDCSDNRTSAMEYAIEVCRPKALAVIEAFHIKHHVPFSKKAFNNLLSLAIEHREMESVTTVLSMKASGGGKATLNHLKQAALSHNPDIMIAVATSPGMGINKAYAKTSPLTVAVRSGDVHMVRAVLNAGADINMHVGPAYIVKTPLIEAIYTGNEAITQVLLDHGAEIPPRDKWPSKSETNDRNYKGVLQALRNELHHRKRTRVQQK